MADVNATGSLSTTDAAVTLQTLAESTIGAEVTGTWTGTVNFEASIDGVTWFAANCSTFAGVAATATLTANGRRIISAAGVSLVRARFNPASSGTAVVTLAATPGGGGGSSGGGGGGGASTIADGGYVAEGTTTDTPITTTTSATSATGIGLWKGFVNLLISLRAQLPAALVGGRLSVDGSGVTQPVSGTVTITPSGTQAVSGTVTANQGGTWTVQPGNTANTTAWKVDGSAVTQPVSGTVTANAGTGTFAVSAAALPLPAGAATEATLAAQSAKLPAALVSGRLSVDGSGVTQPVSGTVTTTPSGTQTVQGAAATGAGVSGNPVYGGGKDTAGNVQPFRLGVDGNLSPGLVSTTNSSTATLTSGSVFTGTSEDVSSYNSVTVIVTADVASASSGWTLQQSNDGTNWDYKQTYTYGAQPSANVVSANLYGKFFRLVYTNGGTNQTSFRLQTIYRTSTVLPILTNGTLASGNNYVNPLLMVGGFDGSTNARPLTISAGNDGASSNLQQIEAKAHQYAYNGSSDDRVRANIITNQFNSTNTTSGATNHTTQVNYNNTGAILTLNITAASGTTPTLDVKVQIADGAGTFFDLTDSAGNAVAFAQKTTTGTDTLKIAPGLIEKLTTTGKQYAGQLPRSYRLVSTVGGTTPSFTYRLDVSELK